MHITPIKSPLIKIHDDIMEVFWGLYKDHLQDQSIICVTSKVVSLMQGRIAPYSSNEEYQNLIFDEADEVYGEMMPGFFAARIANLILPNAGVDRSNSESGIAILLPQDTHQWCEVFRAFLQEKSGHDNIGVIVSDSYLVPMRRGITGVALAAAGFQAVTGEKGDQDLYGNAMQVPQINIADNLCSAAQLLFGQTTEQTPFCVFTDTNVVFGDFPNNDMTITKDEDMFTQVFKT